MQAGRSQKFNKFNFAYDRPNKWSCILTTGASADLIIQYN